MKGEWEESSFAKADSNNNGPKITPVLITWNCFERKRITPVRCTGSIRSRSGLRRCWGGWRAVGGCADSHAETQCEMISKADSSCFWRKWEKWNWSNKKKDVLSTALSAVFLTDNFKLFCSRLSNWMNEVGKTLKDSQRNLLKANNTKKRIVFINILQSRSPSLKKLAPSFFQFSWLLHLFHSLFVT